MVFVVMVFSTGSLSSHASSCDLVRRLTHCRLGSFDCASKSLTNSLLNGEMLAPRLHLQVGLPAG